jgi:hypothetical protein
MRRLLPFREALVLKPRLPDRSSLRSYPINLSAFCAERWEARKQRRNHMRPGAPMLLGKVTTSVVLQTRRSDSGPQGTKAPSLTAAQMREQKARRDVPQSYKKPGDIPSQSPRFSGLSPSECGETQVSARRTGVRSLKILRNGREPGAPSLLSHLEPNTVF